ncbi:MAG: hypothetical protein ACR65Z_09540 [Methylocystis sp.]
MAILRHGRRLDLSKAGFLGLGALPFVSHLELIDWRRGMLSHGLSLDGRICGRIVADFRFLRAGQAVFLRRRRWIAPAQQRRLR